MERQELPVLSTSLSHRIGARHLTSMLPCPWFCSSVHHSRLADSNLLHMQTTAQHPISSGCKLLPCSTSEGMEIFTVQQAYIRWLVMRAACRLLASKSGCLRYCTPAGQQYVLCNPSIQSRAVAFRSGDVWRWWSVGSLLLRWWEDTWLNGGWAWGLVMLLSNKRELRWVFC